MTPTGISTKVAHVGESEEPRSGRGKIKSLYGFSEPHDFTRAFPFVVAIFFLCVFVVTAATAAHYGKVHWGTFRFIYFIYLCGLALVAVATSFAPRVAWPLLALAFIDFSLGMSTQIMEHTFVETASILPIDNTRRVFSFHPLLQAVPTPNFEGLNPAGVHSEFAKSTAIKIHHNSLGMRGPERDSDRLRQQIVIAAVGGSTTYDLGVADGQTWPDVLEHELGSDYAVLNHGVTGYSTSDHLIQTLFYLAAYDITPRCAIYYIGWNDIRLAHLPHIDPGYADLHYLQKIDVLQARKTPLVAEISPLAKILTRYLQSWLDTLPPPESLAGLPPGQGSDSRLEKIYRHNIKMIAAINRARGIASIFVGQLLNRARLNNSKTYLWSALIRNADLWPLQEHFNAILKQTAEQSGSPVFIPPIDQFQDSDFVDTGHFSSQGSAKFASLLAPLVRANCTKPAVGGANSPR